MGIGRADIDVTKSPDDVWAVVGDFGGVGNWMPGIESCVVDGDDRILKMMGLEVTERLQSRDSDERVLVYAIVGGVPVENHRATISVSPAAGGSHVTWEVEVEPDEMADLMRQTYEGAFGALKERLEA